MSDHTETHDFNIIERPEVPKIPNLDAVMARGGLFEPGVVFGMDDELYHQVPALSASGIKRVLVSGMDFWSTSWLAPPQLRMETDSEAKIIGKAYHRRIVEGREAFYRSYDRELDRAAYPKAVDTIAEIREALEQAGVKPKGTRKDELIAQLVHADPSVKIWPRMVEDYAALKAGRQLMNNPLVDRIEIAAAMIEKHPQLCKAFTGGMPEVAVFWVDQATGVPMKSKFDYLKPRAIVDLKSMANKRGMAIDRAIYMAMAEYKYFVQAVVYQEAWAQIPGFIKSGAVHGDVTPEFLNAVATAPEDERKFLFVFQVKGIAPVARGVVFPRRTMFGVGSVIMRDAMERWANYVATFGTDAWIDTHPIGELDDALFPAFASEI